MTDTLTLVDVPINELEMVRDELAWVSDYATGERKDLLRRFLARLPAIEPPNIATEDSRAFLIARVEMMLRRTKISIADALELVPGVWRPTTSWGDRSSGMNWQARSGGFCTIGNGGPYPSAGHAILQAVSGALRARAAGQTEGERG